MRLLITVSLIIFLFCCKQKDAKTKTTTYIVEKETAKQDSNPVRKDSLIKNEIAEDSILVMAKKIIGYIKSHEFDKVAEFVSPSQGVGFSPYSLIGNIDLNFSKKQVANLWNDNKKYDWGGEDESGRSMAYAFRKYNERFIYNRDFANAPNVSVNKILRGPTTTITNFEKIYPNAINVDFHFPNSHEETFYDWSTLRLIFIKENGHLYLRHIIHEEYSI